MNILVLDSWLRELLKTKATTKQIAKYLSLCSQSVEKIHPVNNTDWLYEIEITTNRPDCLSIYGIARELSAILPRFKIPATLQPLETINKLSSPQKENLPLNVKITNSSLCPRFTALILDNIEIKPSPKIIQERLEKCGVRALNNVIDISNYFMLELGQPMHTFDYDKITDAKIILRESKPEEQIITLDGQTRTLPPGTIVIEDGQKRLIDLCGIMGGKNSAVDNRTKKVLLFVQTYDPGRIRRTCQQIAFRTEAASRFEKGVDPEGVLTAMTKAIEMFTKNCNAKVASQLIDIYPQPLKKKTVTLTQTKLNQIMGVKVELAEASKILESLRFKSTINNQQSTITVHIPHWRYSDISLAEDLIEEVARTYGYHNLPTNLPGTIMPQEAKNNLFYGEQRVKNALKLWGFTEIYNYSMVSEDCLKKARFLPSNCIRIINPLTEDLVYMRPSLFPSLLDIIAKNQGWCEKIQVFELANVYTPVAKDKLPKETLRLTSLVQSDNFYQAKGVVEALLTELGITDYEISVLSSRIKDAPVFSSSRHTPIMAGHHLLGYIGEISQDIVQKFGVKSRVVGFDFDFLALIEHATNTRIYHPLPKFPPIIEDLSFIVPERAQIGNIIQLIKALNTLIQRVNLIDSYQNSRTLRIYYQHPNRNLTGGEVVKVREQIIKVVEGKFGARLKVE